LSDAAAHDLDVAHIVEVLNRHGVDYVVIGGVAAAAWAASVGVPLRPTLDVDLTPARDAANLDRLSAALKELGARVRAEREPEGLAFAHDGKSLGQVLVWNLICPAGPFDLSFMPSGTGGHDDLARRARIVVVEGLETPIAGLADIIRSKRAANPRTSRHCPISKKRYAGLTPLTPELNRRRENEGGIRCRRGDCTVEDTATSQAAVVMMMPSGTERRATLWRPSFVRGHADRVI